jgi:hypothetical protein
VCQRISDREIPMVSRVRVYNRLSPLPLSMKTLVSRTSLQLGPSPMMAYTTSGILPGWGTAVGWSLRLTIEGTAGSTALTSLAKIFCCFLPS